MKKLLILCVLCPSREIRRGCLVLLGCALCGCVSVGHKFSSGAIIPGQTTKAELVARMGKPWKVTKTAPGEKLLWQYTKVAFGAGIVDQQELLVRVDARGVVTSIKRHSNGDAGPNIAVQEWANGDDEVKPYTGLTDTQYLRE